MDITYSKLRQNLRRSIDMVADKHQPLFITSHNTAKAVLIAYEDYEALTETAYLLKSPVMAKRLLQAILDIKARKKMLKHGMIDDDK